jgi:hypothetical protein
MQFAFPDIVTGDRGLFHKGDGRRGDRRTLGVKHGCLNLHKTQSRTFIKFEQTSYLNLRIAHILALKNKQTNKNKQKKTMLFAGMCY